VVTHSFSEKHLNAISDHVNGNVLVLTGGQDVLVHRENSKRLHRELGKAELVWVKGAGHGVISQESETVNKAIETVMHKLVARSKL
jgi:pimeloyl-ACP methyl ester carboxylesterase